LLDRRYLAARMRNFSFDRATPSSAIPAGRPAGLARAARHPAHESTETTHYSIVDAAGNAVAVTFTLNGGFGSGVTIPGTGVLMNNEMDDFTSKPGTPNSYGLIQGEANAIEPGKRPLSSMTPTFVFGPDHQLLLVTGSPGGSTIINSVLEVVTNVIDYHLPVDAAVAAPRFHHQWMPDLLRYEPDSMPDHVIAGLRAKGYELRRQSIYGRGDYLQGDTETILIDPASHQRCGAADPRQPDAAASGY
jgi:gamma-glutamyltranspeptidase/glutathione hydrolase